MGLVHKPPRSAEQPGDAKPMVTKNIKVSETGNRPQDVVEKNSFVQKSLEIHALFRVYKEAVCNIRSHDGNREEILVPDSSLQNTSS